MTDNAHFFEEPQPAPTAEKKKNITLTMPEKVELARWIKDQAASQLTYSQLADYAHADLGFNVTPSHVEGMWRQINGKRKLDRPTTPQLPEIPAGMVLVECREMVLLRENLAEARADAYEQSQKVARLNEIAANYMRALDNQQPPEGMVLVAKNELDRLRETAENYYLLKDDLFAFIDKTHNKHLKGAFHAN
jgi:hypothetical protein